MHSEIRVLIFYRFSDSEYVMMFTTCSQNHINLVVVNNVPLFFNVRDGPYMPTLRLLHQCKHLSTLSWSFPNLPSYVMFRFMKIGWTYIAFWWWLGVSYVLCSQMPCLLNENKRFLSYASFFIHQEVCSLGFRSRFPDCRCIDGGRITVKYLERLLLQIQALWRCWESIEERSSLF